MNSDINTSIRVKGSKNDVIKFAKEVFKNKYLKSVTLNNEHIDNMDDIQLEKLIKDENYIEAMGPYGQYNELKDTKVFEDLVDAVPNVEFVGEIKGFIYETNVSLNAQYKNRKLEVTTKYNTNNYDDYLKYIESKISKEKFSKLFSIDELDEDAFEDFFTSEYLDTIEYDTFMDYFDNSEVDEDDFYDIIDRLNNMGIMDFDTYSKKLGDSDKYIYECNSRTEEDKLTPGQKMARQISPKPESIEINGKVFVHTFCVNEYGIEHFIEERNGIVKDAVSAKVDYLIIGDNCNYESSKFKKTLEFKANGKKNIIAMSESEFKELTK